MIKKDAKIYPIAKSSIRLYGYQTISYHGEDSVFVNKLWKYYKDEIDKLGHFFVMDGKVRIYFPLKNAIVRCDGETLYCDSLGCLKANVSDLLSIKIKGRQKTTNTLLTNFTSRIKPVKAIKESNMVIFNLGEKEFCCKQKQSIKRRKVSSESDNAISCVKNHNGVNCTTAFDCYQGRCTVKYDRCMDYNGFGSDCSGSKLYFVGSDCSVAMANGHCWNEIME